MLAERAQEASCIKGTLFTLQIGKFKPQNEDVWYITPIFYKCVSLDLCISPLQVVPSLCPCVQTGSSPQGSGPLKVAYFSDCLPGTSCNLSTSPGLRISHCCVVSSLLRYFRPMLLLIGLDFHWLSWISSLLGPRHLVPVPESRSGLPGSHKNGIYKLPCLKECF